MPISSLAVDLGVFLLILLVVAGIGWWLYRRGQDRQALKGTRESLKAEMDAKEQERSEREAFDAAGRTDLGATPGVRVRPKDSGAG